MKDYFVQALPLFAALLLGVASFGVVSKLYSSRRLRQRRWYVVILIIAFGAWLGSFIATMTSVYDGHSLRDRQADVARIIEREVREGRALIDRMENDQEYTMFPSCRNRAVVERYEKPVDDWRGRTARMLIAELPNSGADQRFLHVSEKRTPTTCGQIDWVYWRAFDLLSNLHHVWESVDAYCRRVGPTCR